LPTSIAHAVAGGAIQRVAPVRVADGWRALLFAVVLANLPDIDFLIGALLSGEPRAWHRGATHTFAAALVVALIGGAVLARRGRRFWPVFGLAFALYASHLLLDTVMPDRRGNWGVPLFWPFTDQHVYAPLPLPDSLRRFVDLPLGERTGSFLESLLTWRAVTVFLVEGVLFLPLLAIAYVIRPRSAPLVRERSRARGRSGRLSRSR
jgi:inner membrane protein